MQFFGRTQRRVGGCRVVLCVPRGATLDFAFKIVCPPCLQDAAAAGSILLPASSVNYGAGRRDLRVNE